MEEFKSFVLAHNPDVIVTKPYEGQPEKVKEIGKRLRDNQKQWLNDKGIKKKKSPEMEELDKLKKTVNKLGKEIQYVKKELKTILEQLG